MAKKYWHKEAVIMATEPDLVKKLYQTARDLNFEGLTLKNIEQFVKHGLHLYQRYQNREPVERLVYSEEFKDYTFFRARTLQPLTNENTRYFGVSKELHIRACLTIESGINGKEEFISAIKSWMEKASMYFPTTNPKIDWDALLSGQEVYLDRDYFLQMDPVLYDVCLFHKEYVVERQTPPC